MSNVVQLFGPKKEAVVYHQPVDTDGLILSIANWARQHNIDTDDACFTVRVSDFIAHLMVMANEERRRA